MDGYGPRAAPVPDVYYRGYEHEELKAMTDAGEPAVSEEIAQRWAAMGGGLEQAGILLQQAVFGSEGGWTGQAAEAMRYRLGQVAEWSYGAGQSFTAASSAVREQSSAVGEAKNRMPEPVPYHLDQIVDQAMAGGLLGIMALPQRMYEQRQKHEAAYAEAVDVTARDLQLVKGAATIPAFSPPPVLNDEGSGDDGGYRKAGGDGGSEGERARGDGPRGVGGSFGPSGSGNGAAVAGGAGPFGSGSGSGSGTTGSRPVGSGPLGSGSPVTAAGMAPKPAGARPTEVAVGRPPGAGSGSSGDVPGLWPGIGFVPATEVAPGLGGSAGRGSGSGGGPARGFGSGSGAPGAGGGPGSGGGPGRGPGGAVGIGPGGAAAAEAAGGRGAAGARGGGAGMGALPLGAARGPGDADTEHRRAGYLQEEDPEGLFGTDERTAPPVIGVEDVE